MSNSELFLPEKDVKSIEFDFLLRPTAEFPDGFQFTTSVDQELHRQYEEEHKEEAKQEEEEEEEGKRDSSEEIKMLSVGEIKVDDDNADGFRTPTSLDHKIPVIRECPPAPRKPRPVPSMKRKACSDLHRLRISFSKEFESLIPRALLVDLSRKIKKVRGDDTE